MECRTRFFMVRNSKNNFKNWPVQVCTEYWALKFTQQG